MVVALLLVLRHQIFAVKEMGGGWAIEVEAFILLSSLAVFFLGGGKYSITGGRNGWD
jgi:putative oxidoreductase